MRVLLLEDDDLVRGLTARTLRVLGHEVLDAASVADAERHLDTPPPFVDVLFADVRLGGSSDGAAYAAAALDRQPGLRVILTSGDPSTLAAAASDPRVRVLPKPYRKEHLRLALEALSDHPAAGDT